MLTELGRHGSWVVFEDGKYRHVVLAVDFDVDPPMSTDAYTAWCARAEFAGTDTALRVARACGLDFIHAEDGAVLWAGMTERGALMDAKTMQKLLQDRVRTKLDAQTIALSNSMMSYDYFLIKGECEALVWMLGEIDRLALRQLPQPSQQSELPKE